MTTQEKIDRFAELVKEKYPTNTFLYCGLYGSQNYMLDTPESDVDAKAIVLPSVDQLIRGTSPVNTEISDEDGALCTVKDIRLMFDNFYKGNINFTEILFTQYYAINKEYQKVLSPLFIARERIATRDKYNLMRMAAAMARQKYVAFNKPFESKLPILEKYGYDPKQLHHLVRLKLFMEKFYRIEEFASSLIPDKDDRSFLYTLKIDPMPLKEAETLRDKTMTEIDEFLEVKALKLSPTEQLRRNAEVKELLDDISYSTIDRLLKSHYLH